MSNVISTRDWKSDRLSAPGGTVWVCGSRKHRKACRWVELLIQQFSNAPVRWKPATALIMDRRWFDIPRGMFSIWAEGGDSNPIAITTAIRLPDLSTYKKIRAVEEYDMEELLDFLSGKKPIENRTAKQTAPGGVA